MVSVGGFRPVHRPGAWPPTPEDGGRRRAVGSSSVGCKAGRRAGRRCDRPRISCGNLRASENGGKSGGQKRRRIHMRCRRLGHARSCSVRHRRRPVVWFRHEADVADPGLGRSGQVRTAKGPAPRRATLRSSRFDVEAPRYTTSAEHSGKAGEPTHSGGQRQSRCHRRDEPSRWTACRCWSARGHRARRSWPPSGRPVTFDKRCCWERTCSARGTKPGQLVSRRCGRLG